MRIPASLVATALDIQDYLDLEIGLSSKDYNYILLDHGVELTCVDPKYETLVALKFGQ